METIEALGEALTKFSVRIHCLLLFMQYVYMHLGLYSRFFLKGGVILVSHDERLIQMICKELWLCRDGMVKSIEGGYDTYRKLIEKELEF